MRRSQTLLILICLLLAFTRIARAAVTGEIVGQGGQRFPIAVSPLKNLGANSADSGRVST